MLQSTHLPFNKYAWLTTHNSFAIEGEPSATGSILKTNMNQEDSVTDQLNVSCSQHPYANFLLLLWPCAFSFHIIFLVIGIFSGLDTTDCEGNSMINLMIA